MAKYEILIKADVAFRNGVFKKGTVIKDPTDAEVVQVEGMPKWYEVIDRAAFPAPAPVPPAHGISFSDAAELLHVSNRKLRALIDAGEIVAARAAETEPWSVDFDSIEAYKRRLLTTSEE